MNILLGRLRIAFRGLWKNPLITVCAIISIALGIGASTAMFTIYDEYLLKPLPVPEPGKLVNFSSPGPIFGTQSKDMAGDFDEIFSYPMFRDLEKAQNVFTSIAAYRQLGDSNITWRGVGEKQMVLRVSGSYFPTLGLKPAIGRLLNSDDDKVDEEAHVAVLSYGYWQSNFGGDPDVLNQAISVNGRLMTIVGVAPRGFTGTTLGMTPRIFVPITISPLRFLDNRTNYWLYIFGRLKPGVSLKQAAAAINFQYGNILNEYEAPETEKLIGAEHPMIKQFREKQLLLKQGARGQSTVPESNRDIMRTRMYIALLLLIIACVNVINLLVVRGMARTGEIALRVSFGATRGQIFRQLLMESLIPVLIAGVIGILAAYWILRYIISIYPMRDADILNFSINETALLFAVLITFTVGIIVGLFPAFRSVRSDITTLLKEQAGNTTDSKSAATVRTLMIIAQIALSLAMLVTSGILAVNSYKINNIDLGMKVDNIITFRVSPSQNGYAPQQSIQFIMRLEEELAAIPGVVGVTSSGTSMFTESFYGLSVNVEGIISELGRITNMDSVGSDYLQTLGISLISGRDFAKEDIFGPDKKVAIVNEAFAELFELDRDVVGKYVAIPYNTNLDYKIIGLVKNTKHAHVLAEPLPFLFRPYTSDGAPGSLVFYVKTALPKDRIIPQIRSLVSRMDQTLPIENLTTMTQTVRDQTFSTRFSYILAVAAAGLATLLTSVGVYGIFAYDVARRRREIGLRMALGATRLRLCMLFLRKAVLISLSGCAISFVLSVFAGRVIQSQLYKFEGFDASVFLGSTVLFFIIIILVVLIPVSRAVMTEPLELMRDE